MIHEFTCARCGEFKRHDDELTTGYATVSENANGGIWGSFPPGAKICFACCGALDKADMAATGRATLYLVGRSTEHRVTNWPGTLSLAVGTANKGRHNLAGERIDVWFRGPDKALWHGVTYGRDTQICHCRRTKG